MPVQSNGHSENKTNWDAYYSKPAATARVTRKITTRYLLNALKLFSGDISQASILEWGGANSCFYEAIQKELSPKAYFIADSNKLGLTKFYETHPGATSVQTFERDVLDEAMASLPTVDICYSVGLIEHFSPEETRRAISCHFKNVKPGGLVVLTFPTPTAIYKTTRRALEMCGLWGFPDERPLTFAEVKKTCAEHGAIIYEALNWPIMLTQGIVVVRTPS